MRRSSREHNTKIDIRNFMSELVNTPAVKDAKKKKSKSLNQT